MTKKNEISKQINVCIDKYSHFVTHRYKLVIIIGVLITFLMIYSATTIETESMDYKGMVPKGISTMTALTFISDEFGQSGQSAIVVLEIEPTHADSGEVNDVRDPRVLEYFDLIGQKISKMDNVISVSSHALILKQLNGGYLPKTKADVVMLMNGGISVNGMEINNSLTANIFSQYVTSDYSVAVLRVGVGSMNQDEMNEFTDEMEFLLETTEPPDGAKVTANGDLFVQQAVMKLTGPETGALTMFSLIGIIILVFVIFASIRYGLSALMPIIFGSIWFVGMIGLLGWTLSAMLVGIISMVMGVGVDFGIQLVTRFRLELREHELEKAMVITIHNVMIPMVTTTLAILAGFKALSFGQLTMLGKMGDMLGLGILMCFIVAMTALPAVLMWMEKRKLRNKKKS
jgi:predicted RND superfamily exporter protein